MTESLKGCDSFHHVIYAVKVSSGHGLGFFIFTAFAIFILWLKITTVQRRKQSFSEENRFLNQKCIEQDIMLVMDERRRTRIMACEQRVGGRFGHDIA